MEESSTTTAASTDITRFNKKKGEKDDGGKIYQCRFCTLKFGKSQALGGHMNRHRQERETETLNRARQLVYGNEGMATGGAHMGLRDPTSAGGSQYHPVYPRLPTQPPPLQPYIYPATATHRLPYNASFPPPHSPMVGEYFIGHAVTGSNQRPPNCIDSNYTCFGPPLTQSFPIDGVQRQFPREGTTNNPIDHGKIWNYSHGQGQHSSPTSSVDRIRDSF